jgi:NAD(P)H-hydrate epimerase
MKIATVSEMRLLDRRAMEQFGIVEEILMENAGLSAFSLLRKKIPIRGGKFVVFCGSGNNGGDGLVVARLIHAYGGKVKVFLLGDPSKFKGAARTNHEIVSRLPVEMKILSRAADARREVAHGDGIIDAIFGTGLDRPVTGIATEAITLINKSRKKVFALDIPSGVHGDTGEIMNDAVRADYTITFGLPKAGNLLYPGYERCGELYVSLISFPLSLTEAPEIKMETNEPIPLPKRPANAYKGQMGDVLFIAGAANYYGAPFLASMSFLKSGGGYARLAAPRSIIPVIAKRGKEIVYLPQEETPSGSLSFRNKNNLLEMAARVDMVVIGPGLSLNEETVKLVRELVGRIDVPLLIDGDGLTAVAENPSLLKSRRAATILTPHEGEMARLTGKSTGEIRKNRIAVLREAVCQLHAIVVLKGAHSLIGDTEGRVYVNLSGNAGMATAGSGDVLTGCIAGMLGMGLTPEQAARKGVFIHGYAGDLAASKKGVDGITAKDIMDFLPQALKDDRESCIKGRSYQLPLI